MLRTTRRLSLRLLASRTSKRTRMQPTIMPAVRFCSYTGPMPPGSAAPFHHKSQCPLHLVDTESFNDIADFDVVITGDFQAALEAFPNLANVLLESAQRIQSCSALGGRINHDPVPNQANFGRPFDHALSDVTAGHRARP